MIFVVKNKRLPICDLYIIYIQYVISENQTKTFKKCK